MTKGLEWGSKEASDASGFMTKWYRATIGNTDYLRIVDQLYPVGCHDVRVPIKGQNTFITFHCSKETDPEHRCPICERIDDIPGEHTYVTKFATVVLHIAKKHREVPKPKPIVKALAWRFGYQKKEELLAINANVGDITSRDLIVTLIGNDPEAEKFQKTSIQASEKCYLDMIQKSKVLKVEVKKELSEANLEEVRSQFLPTYDQLYKDCKRALGFDEDFDPEELEIDEDALDEVEEEEKPKKKSKKKSKKKAKKKKKEEEGLFDWGEDNEEGSEDEEPPEVGDDDEDLFGDLDD